MYRLVTTLVMLCLIQPVCAQTGPTTLLDQAASIRSKDPDSALLLLDAVDSSVLTQAQLGQYYDLRGESYWDAGHLDEALAAFEQSHQFYAQAQADSLAFEALYKVGSCARHYGQNTRALAGYEKARAYAQVLERPLLEGDAINGIGIVHYQDGDNLAALRYYLAALRIYEQQQAEHKLAKMYNNLGIIYKVSQNYPKAITYYRKAVSLRLKLGKVESLIPPYYNLNELYHFTGDYTQALVISKEAMQLAIRFEDTFWQAGCHAMMIDDYISLDQLDSAALHLGAYRKFADGDAYQTGLADNYEGDFWKASQANEKAIAYYEKALAGFREREDIMRVQEALIDLADAHLILRHYGEAIAYAKESHALATQENSDYYLRTALQLLVRSHKAQGQYALALEYQEKYQAKFEETYNESKASKISALEAEQMQALAEQRSLLAEQEAALQAEVINRQRLGILATLAISLLLVLVIYLLYRGQRQKRNLSEARLHVEEERANRIAEELRYKNKEIVNFALHIQQKNELLDIIEKEIDELKRPDSSNSHLDLLRQKVKYQLSITQQRDQFEQHVTDVYDAFFIRLSEQFPDLTESEKRLAALLRINLSSKEISAVINISPKSVDMNRYRLRKKMNLNTEDNLTEVLQQI